MITVKELFAKFVSSDNYIIELYEVNKGIMTKLTVDEILRDDGLRNEWKNAQIVGWTIANKEIAVNIIFKEA